MERKTLKDRFEENYVAVKVPADNKNGFKIKYIYYAPWYRWDKDADELKVIKYVILAFTLVEFVLFTVTGSRRTVLNTSVIVVIPAILGLCTIVFQLFGAVKFVLCPYRTTRMNFTTIQTELSHSSILGAVFFAVSTMTSTFLAALTGFDRMALCVVSGFAVCALLAGAVYKLFAPIKVKTEDNTALNDYDLSETQP